MLPESKIGRKGHERELKGPPRDLATVKESN
jgi:hypothetical protein